MIFVLFGFNCYSVVQSLLNKLFFEREFLNMHGIFKPIKHELKPYCAIVSTNNHLTLFQLKIRNFHPFFLESDVNFFFALTFKLVEKKVVQSWAFYVCCNEHIMIFISRHYVSDQFP